MTTIIIINNNNIILRHLSSKLLISEIVETEIPLNWRRFFPFLGRSLLRGILSKRAPPIPIKFQDELPSSLIVTHDQNSPLREYPQGLTVADEP